MDTFVGLLINFVYISALIGIAELLRHQMGYSSNFTRKVVHIGVGMSIWMVPFLFSTPWPYIFACAVFVVINWLDWRYGFFLAMASKDQKNLGTVYFPIAAGVVTFVFWDQPALMVAALMPLTWGDGLAPIAGHILGKHPYTVWEHIRTLEGSVAFFVATCLFTWLALWLVPSDLLLSPAAAFGIALFISLLTSLTEAISVWGLDNLTITAVAIIILQNWPFT